LFRFQVHSQLVKEAFPSSSATARASVIALSTTASRSNTNSQQWEVKEESDDEEKLSAELARLDIEHGHEWRGIIQEQFGRLWLRLNVPEKTPAKEPLKLPKIRGEGGKVA
jgi:hypothetical protein